LFDIFSYLKTFHLRIKVAAEDLTERRLWAQLNQVAGQFLARAVQLCDNHGRRFDWDAD
jgi:hypothetical protein